MAEELLVGFADYAESGFSSARSSLCDVLRSLIINNIEHFQTEDNSSFVRVFSLFLERLNAVEALSQDVVRTAHLFDFDAATPGNGYRSSVAIVDACVVQCIRLCRTVCINRSSFIFRKDHYLKEVEAYSDVMGSLKAILINLRTLRGKSEANSLFPTAVHSPEEILMEMENIDTACFYGRCLGFQFHESMRKPLKFISLMMASFSDAYYNTGGIIVRTASSMVSCGKYVYSPENRARRIVEIARKASVDFCKAFWLLQENELLQQVPSLVCVPLLINKVIQLPPRVLKLPKEDGTLIEIPIPSSHLPPSPVICRLLSASIRDGQLEEGDNVKRTGKVMLASPYLIIHCHGGGFVAQSSKSHEVYLRDWATLLDVPILSIDYSLAPDAPYPRALEECFYAYAWAVKNCHRLGSTGEKICFVGDSAGGNLLLGVTMKAIEFGIRKPDGILAIYTPVLIDFLPSPSRLLCIMDPLVPFGFMMRCLKAYAGNPSVSHSCTESIGPASGTSSNCNSNNSSPVHEYELEYNQQIILNNKHDLSESIKRTGDQSTSHGNSIYTTSPTVPNLYLKLSQGDITNVMSNSESFEEVTMTDLKNLQSKSLVSSTYSKSGTVNMISLEKTEAGATQDDERLDGKVRDNIGDKNCANDSRHSGDDYVSEFMDWYVLDVDKSNNKAVLRSESLDSEENILFEMPVEFSLRLSEKMCRVKNKVLNGLSDILPVKRRTDNIPHGSTSSQGIFVDRSLDDTGCLRLLMEEFKKFTSNDDPYLSPYLASDEILRQYPAIRFLALQLDPCLDDSVMFAKRLRKLGKEVHVDVLDSLPHGFLNFSLVSKDAHDGSKLCIQRLRELLGMPLY